MKVTWPHSITETKLLTNLPIVGSLYENPTPCHFHVSSDPNIVGLFCPSRGYELDSGKYRECLYRVSQVQSYLIAVCRLLIEYRDQASHFSCPNGRTFFSSSIVWGKPIPLHDSTWPGQLPTHISNFYWPSYRCNRSKTYLWTRFNLYINLIFLVTRSPAPNSILPLHAIFPQIQGPIPQCTSVRDPWKIR